MGMTCSLSALDAPTLKLFTAPDADLLELEESLRAPSCYLDKAWHGLHFLFTGTAWGGCFPKSFLLVGGQEVGEDELISRLYRPAEVDELAAWLATQTREILAARFEPARMIALDIYPSIWDRDPAKDDTLGYLLDSFDDLQAFVAETQRKGLGLRVSVG